MNDDGVQTVRGDTEAAPVQIMDGRADLGLEMRGGLRLGHPAGTGQVDQADRGIEADGIAEIRRDGRDRGTGAVVGS